MVYNLSGHAHSTACIHALLPCRCKRRIAPRDSMHPCRCRSCTPLPKCAPFCAPMTKYVVAPVRTMPVNHAISPTCFSIDELVSLSRWPFSFPPYSVTEQQAEMLLGKLFSACKKVQGAHIHGSFDTSIFIPIPTPHLLLPGRSPRCSLPMKPGASTRATLPYCRRACNIIHATSEFHTS